ncbi:MAG: hypothetical protein KGI57_00730 [Hyphomicrobiales bacterium]|nr:hypothetical protein [Hyphomicrobiales bacterium]MDE2016210.1 hypothetical protein [Hyphomicrobiales bacterium]
MEIGRIADVFDEPGSLAPEAPAKPFKVAPTFVIDLAVSVAFVAAVLPAIAACARAGAHVGWVAAAFFAAILACYLAKPLTVSHLDRAGGDARAYVRSGSLVVDGPYAWSRHPTYAIAMLQFLLWSALALWLQAHLPFRPTLTGAAILLPPAFWLVNERIVMPAEEAALARLHGEAAYAAYAARTNRWFGRRQGLGV